MSERAKRASRSNNSKQAAALERLQKIRSGQERAIDQDNEEEDVFEYLDDDEYIERKQKMIDDDWIENDGAADYFEDGREVFEDDDLDDNRYEREYENYGKDGKKIPLKRKKQEQISSTKKFGNMKNYLISNQKNVQKKTFDQMKVEDDDLLKGILDDINTTSTVSKQTTQFERNLSKKQNNKRKIDDFDEEDLISQPVLSQTLNNPFSISTESNFKKMKTNDDDYNFDDLDDDSLDISELPDSSLLNNNKQQLNSNNNKINNNKSTIQTIQEEEDDYNSELNFNINCNLNRSIILENYQLEDDDNLIFKDNNNDNYLRMYWIDLYEDFKQPGTLYLFGKIYVDKIKKYLSCCVICKNVEHKIYVYPRTHFKSDTNTLVTIDDVQEEMKKILLKYKIKNFRSKSTTKNYAFEKDIVNKSEYLEILFQPNNSILNLPNDLEGDTFSNIFNYNQSSLERFIIDLKLKGPCWLKIKNPEQSSPPISWCKFEYLIEKPFLQIKIDDNQTEEVPFTLMTISMKTYQNLKSKQNEIISISCLINSEYFTSKNNDKTVPKVDNHFCLIAKPSASSNLDFPFKFKDNINDKYKKTKVHVANSERELINLFMAKLSQIDPDILVGHDIQSFDLTVLLTRLANLKIHNWSKLGRLNRSKNVPLLAKERNSVNVGRLLCDTQIAAKELIRSKSYDLTELSRQLLKKERKEILQAELADYYKSTNDLARFIDLSMIDSSLISDLFIELNVLPLYLEITKIAGNILSRTLLGGRAERNEYLLLHAFNDKNYILPEKTFKSKFNNKLNTNNNNDDDLQIQEETATIANKRKKAAYTGGLVLEPKVGFYDKYILLMDFNSLYPSIIQEFNICFTTVDRKSFLECVKQTEDEKLPTLLNENQDSSSSNSIGILPTEICKLVDSRKKVKLMILNSKSVEEKQQLDIKQKALKLTANSMYGCLGFSNSRFYARPLAALITAKGREILSNTKQLTESLGQEVIYGDTDSLMINTNKIDFDEARSIGYKLQAEINKRYKLLEIGIDGIFRSILLLKKKKYAAVIALKDDKTNQIKFEREVKGLDIIRRDWSVIARKVGEKVLDEILSFDQTSEQIIENIHQYLSKIAKEINNRELQINNYLIIKQLTKNPEDYPDKKSLSHVLVALRMNEGKKRSRPFKSGDTIPYAICISKENKNNFNNLPSTQRAFHPEELKENTDLEIDCKYYLQSQVHPIVSRLCDPIEGTDSHVIAEFLGIESTISSNQKGVDLDYELLTKTNETRFDTCKSLIFTCPNKECKHKIEIRNLIEKEIDENNKSLINKSTVSINQNYRLTFDKCSKCSIRFADEKYRNYFINHLKIYLRSFISQYYQTWSQCEDPLCKHRTRKLNGLMTKKGQICPECNENILYCEMTDAQIYLQFNFFAHLLNTDRLIKELPKFEDDTKRKELIIKLECLSTFYKRLFSIVQDFKRQMAYDVVDLTFLFCKQVFSFVKLD